MARTLAKAREDPDRELAALHEKRVALAHKRDELENAERAHLRVVEEATERRRVVMLAEARGKTPSETVEQVDLDRRKAEVEIANARERVAALKTVEQEVGEAVDGVIDANPEHYIAAAEAASEAAAEAIASASQAAQAAATAWQEAGGAWGVVRSSRYRRGLDKQPEVPISDFGNAVNELAKSHSRPFPGGSREAWERFRAYEARAKVKVSNAEAVRRFSGEAA